MQNALASHTVAVVALAATGMIAASATTAAPDADHFRAVALTAGSGVDDNLTNIFDAVTFQGGNQHDFLNPLATTFTLDGPHDLMYLGLTGQASNFPYSGFEDLQGFVQFMASPLSGALIGMMGPLISPIVALMNGQNPVTAFFDGATLNLTPFIETFQKLGLMDLPKDIEIDKIDYHFGGLFTPGGVQGTGEAAQVGAPVPPPGEAPGGSILNSIGVDMKFPDPADPSGPLVTLDFHGQAVGPYGAMAGLYGAIASVIGWPEPPAVPNVPDAPAPNPGTDGITAAVGADPSDLAGLLG